MDEEVRTGRGLAQLIAVGLCALLPTLPRLASPDFCLDDAYIHLSYVKSLHLGDGLSYNPGDHETGMSSPLWVALLALIPAASPPVWAVKGLGVLCHVGTAIASSRLGVRLFPDVPLAGLLAGLCVGTTPLLLQASVSGMEVSLTALLLVLTTDATLRHVGAPTARSGFAAALLASLAYLGRPEAAVYLGLLSVGLYLRGRDIAALIPCVGVAAGLLLWSGYLTSVSGYPLPNTYYVKSGGLHWASLGYLVTDLLPFQPVATSLTGVVALWLALRARPAAAGGWTALPVLLMAAVGAVVAVALTRTLSPQTLFFHSRHAMPFMWTMPLGAGVGLACARSRLRMALALPLVLATFATLFYNDGLVARQEAGVRKLHVKVARHVAKQLPADAVLGVEGAGALRYLTPRTMDIVDLMGLNTGPIAHAPALAAVKLCYAATRGMTHVAYLGHWHGRITDHMELQTLAVADEPKYAQTLPPQHYTVVVARVQGYRPGFAAACAQLAGQRGWPMRIALDAP